MNGKLLVLGGFGLKTLATFLNLLGAAFGLAMASIGNVLSIAASVAIVAGFGLLFLSEGGILNLVIAGGYAVSSFLPLIMSFTRSMAMGKMDVLSPMEASASNVLFSIIGIVALLAWAFKLFSSSNLLGAIAVVGSIGISFLGGLFNGLLPGLHLVTTVVYLTYVASSAALTFAAFLDLQS